MIEVMVAIGRSGLGRQPRNVGNVLRSTACTLVRDEIVSTNERNSTSADLDFESLLPCGIE